MDWASRGTTWPQRERVQHLSDDTLREKVCSSNRARSSDLGAVTRVRRKIEPLLNDPNNVEAVRTLFEQHEASWKRFVESHNYYMSIVSSDS